MCESPQARTLPRVFQVTPIRQAHHTPVSAANYRPSTALRLISISHRQPRMCTTTHTHPNIHLHLPRTAQAPAYSVPYASAHLAPESHLHILILGSSSCTCSPPAGFALRNRLLSSPLAAPSCARSLANGNVKTLHGCPRTAFPTRYARPPNIVRRGLPIIEPPQPPARSTLSESLSSAGSDEDPSLLTWSRPSQAHQRRLTTRPRQGLRNPRRRPRSPRREIQRTAVGQFRPSPRCRCSNYRLACACVGSVNDCT
ncbi:hypothetical protein C8Q78DRAFT_638848 [Trametes maxima]|nr:hypothetical protein C8Q78DRAFT_638848 [Trametes maxima]